MFLPDVWSVMPNAEEYTKITTLYDEALQTKLMPPRKECASPKKEKSAAKKDIEEEKNKVHIYLGSVPIYGRRMSGTTFDATLVSNFHI